MIRLENVTLAPGGEDLLIDVDWHIRQGESVGLVGRNGTGKTTILRAIVGEQDIDGGQVKVRPNLALGYLPQQALSLGVGRSGCVRSAMTALSVWLGSWVHFLRSLRQEPFGSDRRPWVKLSVLLAAPGVLAPRPTGT
jgi:ABC-type Mn2+/Zn2+ transport system ATPase subunit